MSHPPTDPRSRRPMSRGARIAWIFVGAFAVAAVCTVSAVALAAHAVMTSPSIRIQVQEHVGERMSLDVRVPAAVVAGGLAVAPWVIPDRAWEEARLEMRAEMEGLSPELRPLVAQLVRDLATLPDATLVEVEDGEDRVRVEKRGGELRVRVRSPQADVDVSVPLVLVERVASFVEG